MSENAASSRRSATRSLVLCALMAALTAICSQIQIPLPMIPINLALFAVHLSGALLGWKYGALSMVVYALLGVIGVPVFAVIYLIISDIVNSSLRKKQKTTITDDYYDIHEVADLDRKAQAEEAPEETSPNNT